jgi:hypothetical protein
MNWKACRRKWVRVKVRSHSTHWIKVWVGIDSRSGWYGEQNNNVPLPRIKLQLLRFKQINQPDATTSQVYYLTFIRMYSSTCFGRPRAHHQKLNNCSSSLWFYRWSVVVTVLLVVVGPVRAARPRPTTVLPPRSNGKTRGCYCNWWAPDDGREDARNMLSCTYE